MPLYEYECRNKDCDVGIFEAFKAIETRKTGKCPQCGRKGSLKISKSRHIIGFREGFDPGLGQYIGSQRERDRVVESRGLRRIKD